MRSTERRAGRWTLSPDFIEPEYTAALTQRLAAFGMQVIAYDPYVQAGRASQMGVRMTGLGELMRQSDVVTVHLPLPKVGGFAGAVVSKDAIERYYKDEGEKALASSRQVLEEAGIRCTASVLVGEVAETIVDHADKARCQMIYMGTRGLSAIASLALGSVTLKVLQLVRIPILLVR